MYLTHRLSLASEAHKPPAVGEDDQDDEERHSGKDADDDSSRNSRPGPLRVELSTRHPPRRGQPQRRREQPQLVYALVRELREPLHVVPAVACLTAGTSRDLRRT